MSLQWTRVGDDHEPKLSEGFVLLAPGDPVLDAWRPLYSRGQDFGVQVGVRLRTTHCNGRQHAHLALITALADHAMALSCIGLPRDDASPAHLPNAVGLSIDLIGSARVDQWLEVRPRVLRLTRTLGFAEALAFADDKVVARASATYRVG